MFAVPGWSVSAANLKAENAKDGKGAADKPSENPGASKRKRPSGPASNVTSGNVAALYESVIEGKEKPAKKPKLNPDQASEFKTFKKTLKQKKKEKKEREAGKQADAGAAEEDTSASRPDAASKEATQVDKKEKRQKKSKGGQPEIQNEQPASAAAKQEASGKQAPAAPLPAQPKLTPLQASMREKLVSARFRHLNESLYTRPSAEAFSLFEESPEMFQEYHEGFRRQVQVWPENPVDGYIADIKARGKIRQPPRGDKGKPTSGPAPLLRTQGTCIIADLGCGDAKLAETLQSEKKKLNLKILSYDLQSPSPLVTRADIANLPLEDGSVNVVIFCLALMGTNWTSFIEEAYRILHWKGELWIAEIKSRFAPVKKGKVVTHSVGNRKKNQTGKKGKGGPEDDAAREEALAVEVDGVEMKSQETDVSAFVEALRKRGFVLQGQGKEAVDLGNKMFVKMHFTKGATPVVGKGVVAAKEQGRPGPKKGPKFIEANNSDNVDESSILKPCVYKLR
ncbi:methyltransferase-domain-containing protein [Truncatella angustata]|uniref:Ribosomal RNA-processing protein 8 n=1 Tax=Truncatella angustata TaxID=152316 RepID=A0A9P9A4A5_9PEZI|nr:methyltransferase-domain-containing protein [Truncatella angustata]KAH6659704.1 methyltransferase-domain-containing protein [Truncatella angustata]KAH8198885.1 hypothetical protein TruAng_006938 [Truncatella angustata]